MSTDYFSLLKRYAGRKVCLTLHGQALVVGQLASVCYDGLRLTDVQLLSDLDHPSPFQSLSGEQGQGGAPRYRETLIHLNQVLAVTCLDEELPEPVSEKPSEAQPERRLLVETLEVQLGTELLPLIQEKLDSVLMERLERVRTYLAAEMGLLVSRPHFRESPRLPPRQYLVRLRGVTVGRGTLEPDRLLALESPQVSRDLPGKRAATTPFGPAGIWIKPGLREQAEMYGYTMTTPAQVLVAELEELFRLRAADLFGRQQMEELLDQLRLTAPAVVEECIPDLLRPRQVQKVLKGLLREGVPVRDLETILETLVDAARESTEIDLLVERARLGLSAALTDRYREPGGKLYALTLEPTLDAILSRQVRRTTRGPRLDLSPVQVEALLTAIEPRLAEMRRASRPEILLTCPGVRAALRALLATRTPRVVVLSYEEVEPGTPVEVVGVVFAGKGLEMEKRQPPKSEVIAPTSTPSK